MKCHQCDRPALYLTGENKEIPVCLMCQEKIEHIQHLQFIRAAAALNQALNDMDYIMPIAPTIGRMPVAELASAMKKSHTYNNISINNSQVGVVNTGDLAKIDAAITLSQGSDLESLGKILQQFTQSVMSCHELSQTRKQEIVDLIQALSSQAFSDRKPSVLRSLARSIVESVKNVSILAASAESLAHTVHDLFPVAT